MKKTLLLAGVACLFAASANAEVRPYAGLDWNYSTFDYAYDAENLIEDDYQSASLIAGAKLHKNFGVEAFYQLSQQEKNTNEDSTVHSRFQAYGLDALGYLPLGCDGTVELIAGAGIGEYEMKARTKDFGGEKMSEKEKAFAYRLNFGAQYNIDDNWAVRGMYRHVYTQHSEIDGINEFSLGVRYSF